MKRRTFLAAALQSFALTHSGLQWVRRPELNLQPWCDAEGFSSKYVMTDPFCQDEMFYAADSRAIVRTPVWACGPTVFDVRAPPVSRIFWGVFEERRKWLPFHAERVSGESCCPVCFRQPDLSDENSDFILKRCDACRGTAECDYRMRVAGLDISPFYAELLQSMEGVEVSSLMRVKSQSVTRWQQCCLPESHRHMDGPGRVNCLAWRSGQVQGLVMGMNPVGS